MNGTHTDGRRRARLTGLEMLILCVAVAVLAALATASGRPHPPNPATARIRVEPSDTLWSIAREHPLPGADTARTVTAIRELNRMRGSDLIAGQALTVPDHPRPVDSLAMR